MAEEETRTQNKNWFDTDKVPQIKEKDNDDIVGRPAHEAAAAKGLGYTERPWIFFE